MITSDQITGLAPTTIHYAASGGSFANAGAGDGILIRGSRYLADVFNVRSTLAGSTLTMDQALRNLVGLGLTLAEASRRTSTLAAEHLGLADRGRLAPGAWADVVRLDRDLQLTGVVVEGESIEL
mgnify:CR=1 FL=1